jgi:hypothetical protein
MMEVVKGSTEFLNQLAMLARLEGRHGDTSSTAYKRTLAYYALSMMNDFFEQHSAMPRHVIDALDSVAEGLENLNHGNVASVMEANLAQNRHPYPTEIEKVRAYIAAFVFAMTADRNLQGQSKAAVARFIKQKLEPGLSKIANQNDKTEKPEKFLTNLAGKYAKTAIKDRIASVHFSYRRDKMMSAFDRIEPERHGLLIKSIIADIKRKLDALPN